MSKFYNKSKIFVLSSILEGFPNSLAEAMSYGLSCISFDCNSGPSEIIDNKINGYLLKNDIKSLSKHLNLVTSNYNSYQNKMMRSKAKEIYLNLNEETISLKFLNFIIK